MRKPGELWRGHSKRRMSGLVCFQKWAKRDPPGVVSVRRADLSARGRCGGAVGVRTYRDMRAWLAASKDHVYCGSKVAGESASFDSQLREDMEVFENETRVEHLVRYEKWLRKRMAESVTFRRRVQRLEGKTLGCLCGAGGTCHCHVLVKLAAEGKVGQ